MIDFKIRLVVQFLRRIIGQIDRGLYYLRHPEVDYAVADTTIGYIHKPISEVIDHLIAIGQKYPHLRHLYSDGLEIRRLLRYPVQEHKLLRAKALVQRVIRELGG